MLIPHRASADYDSGGWLTVMVMINGNGNASSDCSKNSVNDNDG